MRLGGGQDRRLLGGQGSLAKQDRNRRCLTAASTALAKRRGWAAGQRSRWGDRAPRSPAGSRGAAPRSRRRRGKPSTSTSALTVSLPVAALVMTAPHRSGRPARWGRGRCSRRRPDRRCRRAASAAGRERDDGVALALQAGHHPGPSCRCRPRRRAAPRSAWTLHARMPRRRWPRRRWPSLGGVAAGWVSLMRANAALGPQGRLNRLPSTISPGVGRRRRPIDGQ